MCCSPGASDTFLIARLCSSPRKQLQAVKHTPADSGGTRGHYKNIFTSGVSWWEWDSLYFLCSLNVILHISAWPHFSPPWVLLRGFIFFNFFLPRNQKNNNPEITTFICFFSNSWIFCWGEGVEVPLLLSSMINLQLRKCCAVTALGCDWWRPKLQPSWTRRYIYSLDLLVTE